ncbi:NADH-dependent methylglyoxal reductase [Gehongia tenuis]|uniref:Aldo/keto reductase n=1 Tax=Gehongia tenuis TaxID=2763655 RepID=A0A926HPY3_9FIRM|nr:aldo/keto reductase [Gehongia tenuis]MBC8532144.1 aldo/keto reductase [Gehongia tenuis]
MKQIKLGKTDRSISRLGLGTWAIGGGPAWGGDKDLDECISTIRACPELGINLVDTAPGYNFGQSEEIVGKALSGMNREEMVLITKCGIVWTRLGSLFNKVGDRQLYKNLTRESIFEEIQMSLERLGTDYIDVYMVHWPSVEPFNTPIKETMDALNDLKRQGLIRAIGAANLSPAQVEEYSNYGELDIVQGKYSVLDRAVEEELIPVLKKHGITLQAYSPLEQGLLSGALGRDYEPQGAQCNKKWFQRENMLKAMDMMDAWTPLTQKYNCTIPALALAWVMAQGDFITVLSGAITVDQLKENINAANIELSHEDAEIMRKMAQDIDN